MQIASVNMEGAAHAANQHAVWDGSNLAADFLASEVLVLEVALRDVLLGCEHDSCHTHSELLKHMLSTHHLHIHTHTHTHTCPEAPSVTSCTAGLRVQC